jgi:hypothetical protein
MLVEFASQQARRWIATQKADLVSTYLRFILRALTCAYAAFRPDAVDKHFQQMIGPQ